MNTFNMIAIVAASAALAGCSSSSSGGDDTSDYASFAEIQPDAAAMQGTYTDPTGALLAGVTPATEMDIPDTGSATYDGFVTMPLDDGDLIGQLTVTASFAAGDGTLDSSATGFFHENNGAYTGTLTGAGILVQDPPMGVSQVQTDLGGTLSNGGTDYMTAVALEGSVVANGGDPIGAMAGTADGNVGADIFLDGVFVAEQ